MNTFCGILLDQAKRLRWAFVFLLVVMAYLFAETRYPALNFDDSYHIGSQFPSIAQYPFFSRIYFLFSMYNLMNNEFRTYGLARAIYFGLYQLLGTNLSYYYWIMAAMTSVTALLAAFATKSVTNSRATAIAIASCCLLGPFSLFQTFWHAAYILLPLMVTAAYLALHTGCTTGLRRQVLGGLMCVLVTMTGEVATTILLAAIAILAICAAKTNDQAKLRNLLVEFLIVIAVLGVLYGYYRLEIFNPELVNRFGGQKPVTFSSVIIALRGFNMMVLNTLTCSNAMAVIRSDVHIDYSVTVVISLAIVITIIAIVRSKETARGCSLRPVLFLIALYLTSFIVYVASASREGISIYPYRYLQVSGFLLLAVGCVGAAAVGSKIRKFILVLLVCLSGAGGILTFGIKVPTVEVASEFLKTEITKAKAHGGTRVVLIAPTTAIGFINPYYLQPASSALVGWWILENYCPMIWGVHCTHGTPAGPGDIVIKATRIHEGFMPAFDVTVTQVPTPAIIPIECTATIDKDLSIHIPYLSYANPKSGTLSLWADFVYNPNPSYPALIPFKVTSYGIINNPSFSCEALSLSSDLTIHISDVELPDGITHLWVDLRYNSTLSTNGNIYFVVLNYGVVSN